MDRVERILLRDGRLVELTPKEFDLLLVLVENRGRVVEKERMMQELWPDTAVEEGNLTTNISTLRKALQESPDGRRYIQTVPRRGYRFVGHVSEVVDSDGELTLREHAKSHVVIEQEEETKARSKYARTVAGPEPLTHTSWVNRPERGGRLVTPLPLLAITTALVFVLIAKKPKPPAPDTGMKSIAVLPFKPLVAESSNQSLQLGMAEALI